MKDFEEWSGKKWIVNVNLILILLVE